MRDFRVNKERKLIALVLAIYAVVQIIIHYHIVYSGDDVRLTTISLADIVAKRMADSGRVLTDVVAWVFCQSNIWVWKIFDVCAWVGIALLTLYLLGEFNVVHTLLICLTYLLFPYQIISTAGYVATTTNYVYTYLTLLASLAIIKKYKENESKPKWYSYAGLFFLIVYTANHDQYAIPVIIFLGAILIYWIASKKYKNILPLTVYSLILSIVSYGVLFLTPGHRFRANVYGTWISDYGNWTIFDKIYHGYTSTVTYIFYKNVPFMLAFFIALLLAATCSKKKMAIVASTCCFAVEAARLIVGYEDPAEEPQIALNMPEIGVLTNGTNLCMLLMSFLLVAGIIVSLCFIFDAAVSRTSVLIILLTGAVTREAMGFSESMYGSSYRTYSFFILSLLLVLSFSIDKVIKSENRMLKLLLWIALFGCALWQIPDSMVSLI